MTTYSPTGTIGKQRGTGVSILLFLVTIGIYGLFWIYGTHKEMKAYSGSGLGGGIALLIWIFFGLASPFLHSSEVEGMYRRAGRTSPVSAITGLWVLLPLAGPIIWFVKSNGALNEFWSTAA